MANNDVTLRIRVDSTNSKNELKDISGALRGVGDASDKASIAGASAASALRQISALGAGILSFHVAVTQSVQAMRAADEYQRISAGLTLVEGSAARSAVALQDVYAIAQRQGSALDAVAVSYQRVRRALSLYGGTSQDAAHMTEAVSAALRINSASTAEADAVLRQFSQAMGKGKVNGDEFMSLMENAPTLMDAVARSLGKTKAELYAMSEAGTLTSEVFGGAVLKSYKQLTTEAAAMPKTLGQAAQEMKNSFTLAAGESAVVQGALSSVTQSMQTLGDQASNVLNGVLAVGFAAAVAGGRAMLPSLAALTAAHIGAGVAAGRQAIATVALAGAISTSAGAMAVATTAATALGAAVRFMLGPVGLAITAAAAAWAYFGDNAETAAGKARRASASTDLAVAKIGKEIESATDKQLQLKDELSRDPGNQFLQAEIDRLDAYIAKMERARREKLAMGTADLEAGNGRGSRAKFEREVAESAQFVREEQAKARGESKDFQDRLTKFQQALARGVLTQSEYADSVVQLARDNFKLSDAQKEAIEKTAAALEFSASKQKLINQDLLDDVRSRVSAQVLSEEDGVRKTTKIKIDELNQRIAIERKLADVYAYDPAKSSSHANAAKLAAQEVANAQNSGLRELQAIAAKRADDLRGIELQTQAIQKHGIAIDSVSTLLLKERAARTEVALATAEQNRQLAQQKGVGQAQAQKEVDRLKEELDALRSNADRGHLKDVTQAGLEQTQRLFGDKAEDQFKSLGNTLRETFATSGDGLARMVDAMGALTEGGKAYAREMQVIEKLRETGTTSNLATASKNEQALIAKTAKDQIGAYANMASAAKTYFKEGSTGYKVLEASEKALRTYQLVMSAQTMAKDLAAIGAKVSAWLAGDAAITTSAVTSAGTKVAANMVEGQTNALVAVSNQGKGDPYTAFPRIAAMAAIMAALGFATGAFGGGGGSVTQDALSSMPENNGTGTVFGDSKAQSQSLRNSLESLVSMARPELSYTSQMAASLKNIEAGIVSGTNLLLRGGYDSSSSDFLANNSKSLSSLANVVGTVVSSIVNPGGIFGGGFTNVVNKISGVIFGSSSTSQSVLGSGLLFDSQSIAQAAAKVAVQTYQTVSTTTDSSALFGLVKDSSTSVSTSTSRAGLEDFSTSMSKTIMAIRDTAIAAGKQMGVVAQSNIDAINNMDLGLGKINLKDKTAKEIEDILSQRFSALADSIARSINPMVSEFIKAGEGPYEALMRVSSGMDEAKYYTDRLGVSLSALSLVENKSGDVAAELLRQSIMMAQMSISGWSNVNGASNPIAKLSGIGEIIKNFMGGASDMASLYTSLLDVKSALLSLGMSADSVTSGLLSGAGGIDALKSGLQAFEDGFLTESERAASVQARVADQFARMGLKMPATAEAFKAAVQTLDASTPDGQKQLGAMLSLSSAFKEFVDAQDAANQVQSDLITALRDSGKSIRQWIDKLDSGSLGLSTPEQKLTDARSVYLSGLSLARTNDKEALGSITSNAQDYLQAARDSSVSQAQYAAVLAQVKAELGNLPAVKSYEGQMLDALALINTSVQLDLIGTLNTRFASLDANVDGLLTFSELKSGLSITDAQIQSLIAVVDANGDGQISALEAQTAATRLVKSSTDLVKSSTDGVGKSASQQLQAMVQMNNDGLVAISINTSKALDYANQGVIWLSQIASSTAKIAANPTTVNVAQGGGGGGFIGNAINSVASFFGFAKGDVFGGSGIFNTPTSFNFGTELGALGEAGPEAIMPLKRLGDGSLGVRADLGFIGVQEAGFDASGIIIALQDGFARLSDRIDQLDENNNFGNASIAANTGRAAKVLASVSDGDTIRIEQVSL